MARLFSNPTASVGSFALNVLLLTFMSWKIGRRFQLAPGIFLSQLIHIAAWMVFLGMSCLITNGQIPQDEWQWAFTWISRSALINLLIAAIASTWFRFPQQTPDPS